MKRAVFLYLFVVLFLGIAHSDDAVNNSCDYHECITDEPDVTPPSIGRSRPVSIIDQGTLSKGAVVVVIAIQKYTQVIFIALGLVCNGINVIVFSRKEMLNPTTRILIFLCGSEFFLVLVALIMLCAKHAIGNDQSYMYLSLIRFLRMYLGTALQKACFCFNMFLAAERFIAIAFPLKAKLLKFCKNPVMFCFICLVINMAFHVYNPLRVNIVPVSGRDGEVYKLKDNPIFNKDVMSTFSMLSKICFAYIPLGGCLILNTFLVISLNRHRRSRQSIRSTKDPKEGATATRERQTTITILVSTYMFVILVLPVTFVSFITIIDPEFAMFGREHYLYYFVLNVSAMMRMISFTVDFFVYFSMSQAFRQAFWKWSKSTFHCLTLQNEESTTGPGSAAISKSSVNETTVSEAIEM